MRSLPFLLFSFVISVNLLAQAPLNYVPTPPDNPLPNGMPLRFANEYAEKSLEGWWMLL